MKIKWDLEPAKTVLKTFWTERNSIRTMRQGISAPSPAIAFRVEDRSPIFDSSEVTAAPDSFWEKDDAYGLLLAEPWFWRAIANYSYKAPHPPVPEYYNQSASPLYKQWQDEEREVLYRGLEVIPLPEEDETLLVYVRRLESIVSDGNEHRDAWIESLRSFAQFLRDDMDELTPKGHLEVLFPSKEGSKGMEIRKGYTHEKVGDEVVQVERRYILRRIEGTVCSIDYLAAAEIIQNLIHTALEGRANAQHSALEALAFAWLCLAVGFRRTMTREELVFAVTIEQLRYEEPADSDKYFSPTHFAKVESLFGFTNVAISKTLHDLLLALPRKANNRMVFSFDWETLLRTFRKAVAQSERARRLGAITFLTFMSRPHEAITHRSFLKKKQFARLRTLKSKTVTHRAT